MQAVKIDNLGEWIKKAGESQRVSEFQYPFASTFFVNIAYASKFLLGQIREASKEISMNLRTHQSEDHINENKMRDEYARVIIKGWRGLTIKALYLLVPGLDVVMEKETAGTIGDEVEIPYDPAIASIIMKNSLDFETWIIDIAVNSANFSKIAESKKAQIENL